MIEQRSSGARDYFSAPEAAAHLGVEPQAIRRLIRDGELPARKEIGRWIIPASEVNKRRSLGPRAGRRFSPARAWGLIHLAGGQPAAWLDREARWRMERQLEARPIEDLRGLKLTTMGNISYTDPVEKISDGTYRIGGTPIMWNGKSGTDLQAVEAGFASLTPLRIDITDHDQLRESAI